MNTGKNNLSSNSDALNNIQFGDIFNLEEIQLMQDLFAAAIGVASIITHTDGTPITEPSNFCRLCSSIIRKTEKGAANCIKSDAIIGRPNLSGPIVQPCLSGGLWDAGASITVGGKHIANWLIGQVRNEELNEERMLKYAEEIGADRNEFIKALAEIPVMSVEQFNRVAKMLFTYANELSEKAYLNFQLKIQISEQEKAEAALIEREARLNKTQQIAHLGSWDFDILTNQLIWSAESYHIFGFEQKEFKATYEQFIEAVHPEDRDAVNNTYLRSISDDKNSFEIEHRIVRKQTSEIRYVHEKCEHIRDNSGKIIRSVGMVQDITDRIIAERALVENEKLMRTIAENYPNSYLFIVNKDLTIGFSSGQGFKKQNQDPTQFEGLSLRKIFGSQSELVQEYYIKTFAGQETQFELFLNNQHQLCRTVPLLSQDGYINKILSVVEIITERKQEEIYRELSRECLMILGNTDNVQISIERIVNKVKSKTGFDAVGIRLKEGSDYPYFYQEGFSSEFLKLENSLVARMKNGTFCRDSNGKVSLECTCGLVISGKTDPYNPLFTRGGSAWTNDSFPLLHISIEDDRRLHPRNQCIHHGYGSFAIIPIRAKEKIIGVLQLNDHQKDRFTPKVIEILEGIGQSIGESLVRKQIEEALRKSETRFRSYFNMPWHGITITSPEKGWLEVNDQICSILGYSRIELFFMNWAELTHPDDLAADVEQFNRVLSGEIEQYEMDKRFIRKDGKVIWTNITVGCVRKPDSKVEYIICLMDDITKRKQAENDLKRSEEQFSLAMDATTDGLWDWDIPSKEVYYSPAYSRMLGYEPDEFKGSLTTWKNLIHPEDKEIAISNNMACLNNLSQNINVEYRMKAKDGTYRWILDRGKAVHRDESGKALRMIGTHVDITDQKLTEEKLKQRESDLIIKNKEYEALNDALSKTNNELILAKEKAEESDNLKSTFLANMSHEIRTPMNGILGFTELLKNPDITDKKYKQYINIIEKAGLRMLNIINNIIDILKIESGQVTVSISETDINEQLKSIHTLFHEETKSKGLNLFLMTSLDKNDAIIKTDSEKIYTILTSLVKNALKNTYSGSIEFGYFKKDNYLEFFVKDTGIGIAKEKQQRIFDRFFQLDRNDKLALQGAGLGLSITKAYVELLGGKIRMESGEGEGSAFYFTIPYLSDSKMKYFPLKLSDEDKNIPKGLKILIAEDEETSDLLITLELEKISGETLHAKNGIEAIEICRNNPDLDLILMDIKMPIMDGYEATKQIRKFNENVFIIAQTAYALYGDREKAIESGCNEYITKPIDFKLLMNMIINHKKQ